MAMVDLDQPSGRHTKNCDNLDVCLDDGGGIDGGDVDGGDGDGYDGGAPGLSAWASRERPWLGGGGCETTVKYAANAGQASRTAGKS